MITTKIKNADIIWNWDMSDWDIRMHGNHGSIIKYWIIFGPLEIRTYKWGETSWLDE